jgi:anti-sigma regulatory factor (Ser/Thr protein kinase)
MRKVLTLRLPAVLENVPVVMDRVIEAAARAGLDETTLQQIRLVIDEACANVVTHAYEGVEPGDMEITCSHSSQACIIEVRDWGQGFVLECVPVPDTDCPLDERILGGLGLFLIQHFMDQVEYSRDARSGNVLTMTKKLSPQ